MKAKQVLTFKEMKRKVKNILQCPLDFIFEIKCTAHNSSQLRHCQILLSVSFDSRKLSSPSWSLDHFIQHDKLFKVLMDRRKWQRSYWRKVQQRGKEALYSSLSIFLRKPGGQIVLTTGELCPHSWCCVITGESGEWGKVISTEYCGSLLFSRETKVQQWSAFWTIGHHSRSKTYCWGWHAHFKRASLQWILTVHLQGGIPPALVCNEKTYPAAFIATRP